jgi:4-hydroxybenzoate polyprenyltransferase
MIGLLINIGNFMSHGKYYFLALGVATGLAIGQYEQIKKRLKTDCFKAFLHNNWIGLAIFIGLAAQYLAT